MDLAQLGIEVKSESVPAATKELKGLQDQAGKTEAATEKLGVEAVSAGKALQSVGGAAGIAGRSLGNLIGLAVGAVAAVAAFVGTLVTMDRFVEATTEAEAGMAQLEARLKATGDVSGRTAAGLEATAKALQAVTTYSDDTVISMQAVLLQFRNIRGDTFDRATKSAVDLAAAMGTDLNSAAQKLGQALNFPISGMTVLSRAGVKFTTDQKKVIEQLTRTGDVAGAQKIILDELEKSFGGAAAAARDTLGGALSALKNAFNGLFIVTGPAAEALRASIETLIAAISDPGFVAAVQTVGAALFNAMSVAVSLVAPLVNGIAMIGGALQDLAPYAVAAAAGLALIYAPAAIASLLAVAAAIPAITGAVVALGVALAATVGLPVLIVGGLVAIVAAAVHFRDDITKFLGVDIVGVAKDAVNSIIGSFVAAYHDIGFIWKNFPDIIEAAVFGAINAVSAGVAKMVDVSKKGINDLIDTLNHIPGIDLAGLKFDTSKATDPGALPNAAADRLAKASDANAAQTKADMSKDYLGAAADGIRGLTDPTTKAGEAMDQTAGAAFKMGDAVDTAAKKGSSALKDLLKNAQDTIDKLNQQAQSYGMNGIEADTLAFKLKLLADASDKGRTVTPEFRKEVDRLTDSFRQAATAAAEAKLAADAAFDRQQLGRSDSEASIAQSLRDAGLPVDLEGVNAGLLRTNEYLKEGRQLAVDFFQGFSQDLQNGATLLDALKNSLKRLAQQLIDMALNSAIQSLFGNLLGAAGGGGAGGGVLDFVLNGFRGFAEGGFTGGSENKPAGVVHGQEFVANAETTRKNRGLLHALNDNPDLMNNRAAANSNAGPTAYSPTFMIDARGAQAGVADQIASALDAYDKGRVGRLAADLPVLRKRTGQG